MLLSAMGTLWCRLRCSRGQGKRSSAEPEGYTDSHQGYLLYGGAKASASRSKVIFCYRLPRKEQPLEDALQ